MDPQRGQSDNPLYHPVLSVRAATIRDMTGDQETVTAAATVTASSELVQRGVSGAADDFLAFPARRRM